MPLSVTHPDGESTTLFTQGVNDACEYSGYWDGLVPNKKCARFLMNTLMTKEMEGSTNRSDISLLAMAIEPSADV